MALFLNRLRVKRKFDPLFLLFLFDLGVLLISGPQKKSVIYGALIFAIIGAVVSYFRTKKRGEDFAKSIYDLFLVRFSEQG